MTFSAGIQRPLAFGREKPSTNAFLPDEAKNIFQAGNYHHVPMIIGYADVEGIASMFFGTLGGAEPIHKDFERFVPLSFGVERGSEASKRVAQKIKEFYYKDRKPSLDTLDAYLAVNLPN